MSSKTKRLKKTALETPPPALATVAVGAAAPVGRQASECGVRKWVGDLGREITMSIGETARTGR